MDLDEFINMFKPLTNREFWRLWDVVNRDMILRNKLRSFMNLDPRNNNSNGRVFHITKIYDGEDWFFQDRTPKQRILSYLNGLKEFYK